MNEQEFKAMMLAEGRKGMLHLMRAWGFTAHKIKTDAGLADALWKLRCRTERLLDAEATQ